jgi:hypothetical protein
MNHRHGFLSYSGDATIECNSFLAFLKANGVPGRDFANGTSRLTRCIKRSDANVLFLRLSTMFSMSPTVTVLAATAAQADVAATLIANAVNIDDARIQRRRADSLRDDTDLGDRMVTVEVPD